MLNLHDIYLFGFVVKSLTMVQKILGSFWHLWDKYRPTLGSGWAIFALLITSHASTLMFCQGFVFSHIVKFPMNKVERIGHREITYLFRIYNVFSCLGFPFVCSAWLRLNQWLLPGSGSIHHSELVSQAREAGGPCHSECSNQETALMKVNWSNTVK